MKGRTISRREFIRVTAITAAGAVAAACSSPAPQPAPATAVPATAVPATAVPVAAATAVPATAVPPTAVPPTVAPVAKYKEAPMLAELVKAGKLPPVDARLPKNPVVLKGFEGVGNYGGTWRRAFKGVSDYWGPTKCLDRSWAWFDKDLNLFPRMVESWSVSDDGKVWTLKLREGLKWSDGKADYTTDDIAFWFENELKNKKLTPGVQTIWADPDKTMMKFEAVDKYTAKFTYGKPKPMFMYNMTRGGTGGGATIAPLPVSPAHYMKEFHEDTTSDKAKLAKAVTDGGFADWQTYYMQFARQWTNNPDRPTLGAWRPVGTLKDELFVSERNPYFFAVDEEGQQLPYIDKLTHRLMESQEVLNLWITNGEIDMQYRHMQEADLPLYKQSEAAGDFKVVLGVLASHVSMQLNLTSKKPALAEFFNERNVRIALSLACNREEVNQLVYNGLLKPRQYSPLPMSPQYYPKLSEAYLDYDPDQANKLLDEAGFDKKDANGIRQFKDGSGPVSFILEGIEQNTQLEDAFGLISGYFEKVGVKMAYKYVERALYTEHYDANDLDGGTWGGDRTVLPIVPEAIIFRGVQRDRPWCPGWSYFYNEPDSPIAVKPPDGHWIYDIWKIWDEEVVVEPDPAKQTAAFKKLLDIWATELPMITLLGERPSVTIVKNGFKGYPAGMPNDDTVGDEHFCQGETFYWDNPAKHA